MADYIYLLRTRLSPAQQTALEHVRQAARAHGATVFLVGGAVRDLTSGSPIHDIDVAVQGNALKLRKELQKSGGVLIGENDQTQSLYFNFPGGVRLEVGSTLSATYPKPGKPVFRSAGILDDLRRRDFTANAMAISLNEGSYGLLMDPMNGVADIENRELRLVSNYGFIEDPIRMVRAERFAARFGWQMEEKTQQRYETGKAEGYLEASTSVQRGYELEEIFHEEDPLRVLRRLEAEGWAQALFPAWSSAKANEAELERLRDTVGQLEAMGIFPDPSPAYFPLLTAKLNPKETAALKESFARPGFVEQIAALEADTKAFAAQLSSKAAAAPSDTWKMLFSSAPEPVLWLAHSTKSSALQAKFKSFFNEWSQARQKIPYQLMQEMRIQPDLPGYDELLETIFFAIMDEKLETPEAAKAFLEPYSPPAPPPPVNLRRRAVKRETKPAKSKAKKMAETEATAIAAGADGPAAAAPTAAATKPGATPEGKAASTKGASAPAKAVPAKVAQPKAGSVPVRQPVKVASKAPVKAVAKTVPSKPVGNKTAAKKVPTKVAAKAPSKPGATKSVAAGKKSTSGGAKKAGAGSSSAPAKPTAAKVAGGKKPVNAPVKAAAKAPVKAAAKAPVKAAAKATPNAKKAAGKAKPPVRPQGSAKRPTAGTAHKASVGSKAKPKARR